MSTNGRCGPAGGRCPGRRRRVTVPIGMSGREQRRVVAARVGARGSTTMSPLVDLVARGDASSTRSSGLPDRGLDDAGDAGCCAGRARGTRSWVGEQRHLRRAGGDDRDLADQARRRSIDRLVGRARPSRGALVDVDRRVPDRRRVPVTRALTGSSWSSASSRVEVELAAQLGVLALPRRSSATLAARSRSRSLAQVVALALGVQRVAEPAEEVADGLERAARALLDRARRPRGRRAGRRAARRRRTRRSRR